MNYSHVLAAFCACILLGSAAGRVLLDQSDSTQFNADYGKALGLSFLFYEAQRSGKLPPTNRIPWRGDSHLSDCIVGGYHDAGDHLKLAFPLSTSLAFLALGVTEFGDAYSAAGQLNWALDAIRWGTDFLVAAHSSPNEFVGQIGDPGIDHAYWGRPEQQTGARPCFVWNSSTPASDLLGAAASGLAAGSMAFQQSDSSYAQTLLSHAQQLYSMATASEGKYSDTYSSATYVYSSGSFRDDLALAAALLWKATGNQTYLHDAVAQRSKSDFAELSFLDWDSVSPLSAIVLQCGGQGTPDTADHIAKFVSDWQTCNGNGYKVTPNGLCIAPLGGWGDLRYATSAAFGMLLQAKCEADPAKRAAAVAWAKSQVDYALGSTGRSFVVGYGNNYPLKAHHRAASCPDMPATCDFSAFNSPLPNPQILSGAVVGGPPGPGDNYVDDRTNYQTNEVAVDFNAGFTGALAGLLAFQNGTVSAPSAVTKAGQEGLLLAPEMAPSVESVCDDVAPDSSATCAQQASYGKCGEAWMQGAVCRKSCGRC